MLQGLAAEGRDDPEPRAISSASRPDGRSRRHHRPREAAVRGPLDELGSGTVSVRAARLDELSDALTAAGFKVRPAPEPWKWSASRPKTSAGSPPKADRAFRADPDGASLEAAFPAAHLLGRSAAGAEVPAAVGQTCTPHHN